MLNTAILMGRLTADPELKKTPSDLSVTRFSVAIDRRVKSGGERQTDFINVVAWRQTADFVANYFKKGQMIAVEGSIQTNRYQDKDGNNRTSFEVVANNVSFCESKRDSGNAMPSNTTVAAPVSFATSSESDFSEISADDDLPF